MPGRSQDSFFANVSDALTDRGQPVDLPDDLEVARVIAADRDIVDVFATRVEESGMHAHRASDEQAMLDKIVELIRAAGAASAIVPDENLPARDAIRARLKDEQIDLLDPDDADASFAADVGITGVTSAVAETASMCITSGGGHRRLASLAVPWHIGIVRAAQIVPDLLDWTADTPAEMPANTVLISAPSKTADIEILVDGVHGPGEVHVIIVG